VDYLLKPVDKDDLVQAVQKVFQKNGNAITRKQFDTLMHNINHPQGLHRIALPAKDGFEFVPVNDILYCEADGNFTKVVLHGGKKHYITRLLKDLEQALAEYAFCRIHHAYVIHLNHVAHYSRGDGGSVKMSNGDELPVSRAKKEEFLSRIKW
jgi:two-component system LytT family response regulator